jgi:hypothetical protein
MVQTLATQDGVAAGYTFPQLPQLSFRHGGYHAPDPELSTGASRASRGTGPVRGAASEIAGARHRSPAYADYRQS